MEVVEVEGSGAVFLPKDSSDSNVFESIVEVGPFVVESDHVFDAFLTFLLERCEGGGSGG